MVLNKFGVHFISNRDTIPIHYYLYCQDYHEYIRCSCIGNKYTHKYLKKGIKF
jgi:hypothetical protein